jgi:hypothetical protein
MANKNEEPIGFQARLFSTWTRFFFWEKGHGILGQ